MKIYRVASTGTAHLTDAVDPICGSRVGAGTVTWGEVTCKRCLKWVASRDPREEEAAPAAPVTPEPAETGYRVAFIMVPGGERREGTVTGVVVGEWGRRSLTVLGDDGSVWGPWEGNSFRIEPKTSTDPELTVMVIEPDAPPFIPATERRMLGAILDQAPWDDAITAETEAFFAAFKLIGPDIDAALADLRPEPTGEVITDVSVARWQLQRARHALLVAEGSGMPGGDAHRRAYLAALDKGYPKHKPSKAQRNNNKKGK